MSNTKRIIPCLDIKNGRIVKGVNFLYLSDAGNPIKVAKKYYQQGADEIIFLNITASLNNEKIILNLIKEIAKKIFIPLTIGGGIKNLNDVEMLLNSGADRICINTSAIINPNLIYDISKKYGSQCLIIAIDVKKKYNNKWEVFSHGGNKYTGIDAIKWANKVYKLGAGELLITSMDRDGTYNGFDLKLIKNIKKNVNIPIIASGGVGNLQDLVNGIIYGKADAVLAASIFHYNKYSIKEAKIFMSNNNIPVRL